MREVNFMKLMKTQGYYWEKKGKLTFCYTKFISIHIIFGKKEKKKREKGTAAKFSQVERSYHVTSFFSFSYSLK